MDPIKNPFSPGAGSPPPELVGRGEILTQSHILLARVKEKRPEKSFLLTGLRGVGKTVLLNEIERLAEKEGYKTVLIEAHEKKSLGVLLVPYIRRLLYDLDRTAGAGDKVRRGLGVLKSFINSIKIKVGEIEFGLGIDPEQGTADSGDLEVDLPSLFVALAEAAEERKTAVAILIDELQYFSINEISALIMAMHKIQQRQLPLVFVGAGLPILPALAGESKTYAERLFLFPNIGALSKTDAIKALQDPVKEVGVEFSKDALNEIFDVTKGYPYIIQEWGYQSWNYAKKSPISFEDNRTLMKKSLLCPDFRPIGNDSDIMSYGIKNGKNHLAIGYLPCRVLKSISYGNIGITDSYFVKEILGDHVLYHSDMQTLFERSIQESKNYERIKRSMEYVQKNHTYVNRAIDLIRALLQ